MGVNTIAHTHEPGKGRGLATGRALLSFERVVSLLGLIAALLLFQYNVGFHGALIRPVKLTKQAGVVLVHEFVARLQLLLDHLFALALDGQVVVAANAVGRWVEDHSLVARLRSSGGVCQVIELLSRLGNNMPKPCSYKAHRCLPAETDKQYQPCWLLKTIRYEIDILLPRCTTGQVRIRVFPRSRGAFHATCLLRLHRITPALFLSTFKRCMTCLKGIAHSNGLPSEPMRYGCPF